MQASGAPKSILARTAVWAIPDGATFSPPENAAIDRFEAAHVELAPSTVDVIDVTTILKGFGLVTVNTSGIEEPGYRPLTVPAILNDAREPVGGDPAGSLLTRAG